MKTHVTQRSLAIGAALAACIGWLFFYAPPWSAPTAAPATAETPTTAAPETSLSDSARVADLQTQLEELVLLHTLQQSELAELRGRFEEPGEPASDIDAESLAEEPTVPLHESLAEQFHRDSEDPSWESEVHGSVLDTFAERPELELELRSVECRTNNCRLRIANRGGLAGFSLIEQMHTQEPFTGEMYVRSVPSPDGRGEETEVYLARPDGRLIPPEL